MTRPNITRELAARYLAHALRTHKPDFTLSVSDSVFVLGVRGYYLDSKGELNKNDRGIYDDAIVVCSPSVVAVFNGNCDPSAWRKGIATLRPGLHPYKPGNHGITRPGGGYPAFRPATKNEELPVERDGELHPRPGVAINIHKGGRNSTSSLGCQTLHPDQWEAFHALVHAELRRAGLRQFIYVLVDEVKFRADV